MNFPVCSEKSIQREVMVADTGEAERLKIYEESLTFPRYELSLTFYRNIKAITRNCTKKKNMKYLCLLPNLIQAETKKEMTRVTVNA